MSRGSLMAADAIALFVTWYKIGAQKTSTVTTDRDVIFPYTPS